MNNSGTDRHAKIICCIFAALCIILAAALVVLPKSNWSDNENRKLAEFPEFSVGALVEGDYLADIEDYLADHFPLRDAFVSLNTRFCTLLGRTQINGVFICDDGFLIDRYNTPTRTETILSALNRLPESVGDRTVTLLLAPTAAAVYSDKLPAFAQQADQLDTMERYYSGFRGGTVDVTQTLLEHRDEYQLYYRTDHHWTTYGAYYAYAELCGEWGFDAVPMEEYVFERVTTDFCGTTYSKVNDFSVDGEDMYSVSLPGQNLSIVYGSGEDTSTGTLYNEEYLGKKDKYSYFLDNIHELITITNPDALTDRELVLIKDSYANCLVPFLAEHFARISIFDLRHYRGSVVDFINSDSGITDVLVLYNLGTIDSDTGVTVIY